jgi:hypothetical protein
MKQGRSVRHCERSEAIQKPGVLCPGLLTMMWRMTLFHGIDVPKGRDVVTIYFGAGYWHFLICRATAEVEIRFAGDCNGIPASGSVALREGTKRRAPQDRCRNSPCHGDECRARRLRHRSWLAVDGQGLRCGQCHDARATAKGAQGSSEERYKPNQQHKRIVSQAIAGLSRGTSRTLSANPLAASPAPGQGMTPAQGCLAFVRKPQC